MRWTSFGPLWGAFMASAAAIDSVEIVGNKFFNTNGSQFFIKGVAYQLRPDDPLIDTEQCQRDAALMKELGNNALRVYHVDAKADHDGCMEAFANAGIYLLIDLDTFDTYITPSNKCWSTRQYNKFSEVMDAFHGYSNLLAFFLGNENIAVKEDSFGAPFIKAAARDMKAYRDSKGYRKIPIGFSAADIREIRPMLQNYLTCGGNSSEIVDFFGLNSYSWCDPSSFEKSTYNQLQEHAKDFPVPVFFTETGCNVPGPRLWEDQDAILGEKMVGDWSGAIIYEWIQEQNNYGIISYGPPVGDGTQNHESVFDNWIRKGTPTPVNPDFGNLQAKWASLHPTGVSKGDYDPIHVSTRVCPRSTEGGWWQIKGNVRLPVLDETITTPFSPAVTVIKGPATETAQRTTVATTGSMGVTYGNKKGETDTGSAGQTATLCASLLGVTLGLAVWL